MSPAEAQPASLSAVLPMLFAHGIGPLYMAGLAFLAVAVAISDLRVRRIPNAWLLAGLGYALALLCALAFMSGPAMALRGLMMGLFGMLVGGLACLPGYMARQMAAGDVKFMMVIGFFLGPMGAVFALLNAALVGGLWALGIAWRSGGLGHVWHNLKFMARSAWLSGLRDVGWDLSSAGALRMPYGVALSIGACSVIAWQVLRSPTLRAALLGD